MFLAHSLGGLVIKQAVVDMKKSATSRDLGNFSAICGMLFFGVPNDGMNIGPLKLMVHDQPNEEFIMSLANNSQLLRNLGRDFAKVCDSADFHMISIYETRESLGPSQVNHSFQALKICC